MGKTFLIKYFYLDDLKDVKRNASNYLTDPNIDKQIWDWYQTQTTKPTGKQVSIYYAREVDTNS